MEDRKNLLNDLTINREEVSSSSKLTQYSITGVIAIVMLALAWYWIPVDAVPEIRTVRAVAATEPQSGTATVLDASGYVTARRQATVSSKVTGKVAEIFIEEGLSVVAGQLLARLDASMQLAQLKLSNAQLDAAQAGMAEFEVQLHEAELTLKRTLELVEKSLASQADLDQAHLAVDSFNARLESIRKEIIVSQRRVDLRRQQLDDTEIRAPFAGVVIAKAAQPGEMISPLSAGGGFTRTGICTIVDMNSLEIEVDVNEAYIDRVSNGQAVTASLNSYPDWEIPAEVITIIPTADRNKATVRVRIKFLETDSRILPDMGVKVAFLDQPDGALDDQPALTGVLVPSSSIANKQAGYFVYVIKNKRVEVRPVTLGGKVGSQRNIVEGLNLGEAIIAVLSDELAMNLGEGSIVSVVN